MVTVLALVSAIAAACILVWRLFVDLDLTWALASRLGLGLVAGAAAITLSPAGVAWGAFAFVALACIVLALSSGHPVRYLPSRLRHRNPVSSDCASFEDAQAHTMRLRLLATSVPVALVGSVLVAALLSR
jgi:hypothetical protein